MAALSYQMLTGGGVAPQALSQPAPAQGIFVSGQHMANGLRNVYQDPASHMEILYSLDQTPYKSNMVCAVGVAGVNNDCLCPGVPSGVPYRQGIPNFTRQSLNAMFSPIQSDMFPRPTAAAQSLIAERGPCPLSAYQPMDMTPLGVCSPSKCV